MRIAFYAPMKPPTASHPSGDRRMGRALMAALRHAGHEATLASRFRSRDGAGDPRIQARLRATGLRLADRLCTRYAARDAARPQLWFTYHVYYKAPDWIGPQVSRALGVPYVVAEASHAPKRAGGAWAIGHEGAAAAIRAADRIVGINAANLPCVLPLLDDAARMVPMKPFLDTRPFTAAAASRGSLRRRLADSLGLAPDRPLLVTVAMMRPGDKLVSYRTLADALARTADLPWQLLIVGDGPARPDVERAMAALPRNRLCFLGERATGDMPALLAAADLYVWPAVREAYGMAILEAQAAGLPVIAGDAGGVAEIIRHGKTGLLTPEGDADAFAEAVRSLLSDRPGRERMRRAAAVAAAAEHSLGAAAAVLDEVVTTARQRRAA